MFVVLGDEEFRLQALRIQNRYHHARPRPQSRRAPARRRRRKARRLHKAATRSKDEDGVNEATLARVVEAKAAVEVDEGEDDLVVVDSDGSPKGIIDTQDLTRVQAV